MLLGSVVEAMEEVLDDQPLFHAVVGAGCNVFLESFLRLRHRFICELLEAQDAIPQSTSLPEWEVLGEEGIGTCGPHRHGGTIQVEPLFSLSHQ